VETGGEAPASSRLIVEGLVSLESRGFTGATVYAYHPESFSGGDEPVPSATAESGANGRFSMELPEGKYILLARAPGKFAWFGRNPLKVSAHQRGLSLPLVNAGGVTASTVAEGEENVSGKVLLGGRPAAGVRVTAHLRADAGFRGQPYASSALTSGDGEFRLALEPGAYFITARKRATGLEVGPLTPGDLFGILPELPVKVGRGKEQKSDIELVELPSYEQQARYRTRFSRLEGTILAASTTTRGCSASRSQFPLPPAPTEGSRSPSRLSGAITSALGNTSAARR
jgi:hypothetical protein